MRWVLGTNATIRRFDVDDSRLFGTMQRMAERSPFSA
jgi:hypothetical protein